MMTAPTAGVKTTRVNAHESNQECIESIPLRLGEDPQGDSEQSHRSDEHECVELQATGLDLAHLATGFAGDRRETVDQTVDALLVDVVVREASEPRRPRPCS